MSNFSSLNHLVPTLLHRLLSGPPSGGLEGYLTVQDVVEMSLVSHSHDDSYYTESEIDSLLSGLAPSSHAHDDRYYTEAEIDSLLSAISGGNGVAVTSYAGNGSGARTVGFSGDFVAQAVLCVRNVSAVFYCCLPTVGMYVAATSADFNGAWAISSSVENQVVVPSLLNASGYWYHLLILGV